MRGRTAIAILILLGAVGSASAAESAPAKPEFRMNPKLAGVTDNTWVKMAPKFEPVYKNHGGFDHPKTESFLVYDESTNLTVWFGGCSLGYTNSTWLYDCSNDFWKEANPGTWITVQGGRDLPDEKLPPGCCQAAMCYSPDLQQCLMFKCGGGSGWHAWNQRLARKHPQVSCWWYNARENKWTLKEWDKTQGPRPAIHISHQFHYDRANRRGLVFAGLISGACNELWSYDPAASAWAELKPAGELPAKRMMTSGCYDEKNKVLIAFGGQPDSNDTWLYDPAKNAWREVKSDKVPSARHASACSYDAASGVMVLFGGRVREKQPDGGAFKYLLDTWVFDAAKGQWAEMKPAEHPESRRNYQMAYDRVNNVSIIVSGKGTWAYRYRNAVAGGPGGSRAAKDAAP